MPTGFFPGTLLEFWPSLHSVGYHLYTDNYYIKMSLLEELYAQKVNEHFISNQQTNSKFVFVYYKLLMYGRKRGDNMWRMKSSIVAQVWVDSKPVHLGTTSMLQSTTHLYQPQIGLSSERGSVAREMGSMFPPHLAFGTIPASWVALTSQINCKILQLCSALLKMEPPCYLPLVGAVDPQCVCDRLVLQ